MLAFAALVQAAALAVSLPGQSTQQAPPDQRPAEAQTVFRSAVGIVALNVAVQDSQSRYVSGLSRDDFAVFENDVPQPVRLFEAASLPLDLILLLDTSESMTGKIEVAQAAAHGLLATLRDRDRAAVVLFNQRVRTLAPLTADRGELAKAVGTARPTGTTALHDAIHIALTEYARPARARGEIRRQVIVVLSDGEDTSSRVSFDAVLGAARATGVTIYTIRVQERDDDAALEAAGALKRVRDADRDMRELARETGGVAFFPQATRLRDVYATIAEELASQYAIGYEPSARASDGTFRWVRVRILNHPDLSARTRTGYLDVPQ